MTQFIINLFGTLALGFFINISLSLAGHKWARNFSFSLTCLVLPMVASVIATVISGNIALSLGMVGALSIVRFRHPVKTPFELSIYFLLLTVGISFSVFWKVSVLLTVFSMASIYIYSLIVYRKRLNGFIPNLETISMEEVFILEVSSNSEIKKLSELDTLMFSHINIIENKFLYKIRCSNIKEANELSANLDQEVNTITSKKIIKV